MQQLVLFIHILICFALLGLILLQQGKGAQMGAAFGSGSSNTLFGSRGPASFLMKLTATLVTLFFITCLGLGYLAIKQVSSGSNLSLPAPTQSVTIKKPVAPKIIKKTQTTKQPAKNISTVPTNLKGGVES